MLTRERVDADGRAVVVCWYRLATGAWFQFDVFADRLDQRSHPRRRRAALGGGVLDAMRSVSRVITCFAVELA